MRQADGEFSPRQAADHRRAELRRYAGAYFQVSGWLAFVASVLQLTAVALATLPSVRSALEPLTKWIVLALAGIAYSGQCGHAFRFNSASESGPFRPGTVRVMSAV